jgi:ketosteroid isomerase-like protein
LNAVETVDSFQKRLAQGDTSGATQLLDPSVLIFEGGGAERSRAEYASHHLKSDAEFLKDAEVRQLSRTGNGAGDFAWVATESELKSTGAKPVDLVATETMVLRRGPEGWRVTHIHWSSRPKKK